MQTDLLPIIIQKFGGTTMAGDGAFQRVETAIRRGLASGAKVVAVVSAMGRGPDQSIGRKGDPYATDTLLSLLPPNASFVCLREKDLLMMCGEIISAVSLACYLRSVGISARARSGFEAGIITDENSNRARIRDIIPDRLLNDLHLMDVVVVAGFQGISEKGKITTLGRGGSDTTAIALGKALDARSIEIYTDQTGVFSADPREVPDACLLDIINAKDIVHMSWAGAKVIDPRAAELLDRCRLNVRVGRVDRPQESTTIEVREGYESSRLITAIAHGDNVTQFTVFLDGRSEQSYIAGIFEAISESSISMDMFTITEELARFTVEESQAYVVTKLLERIPCRFELRSECRKVSIVGAGMHKMKGVMARFMRSLVNAGITVLQTADSHATISALVMKEHSVQAQKVLHREFIEP